MPVTANLHLGLGSNLGDREANLREARSRIAEAGLPVVRASSVYETEPVGFRDQGWFLNQVIEVAPPAAILETSGGDAALEVLRRLLHIENEMGRRRAFANGPRVIDIDLLLWGGLIVGLTHPEGVDAPRSGPRTTELLVPHPRLHLRRFVLEPLAEIAPDIVHPQLNRTVRELLAALEDDSAVRKTGVED